MERLALRPQEAAASLGVSERTLRRWMSDAGLPYRRVEGLVLIPRAALERWLEEGVTEARKVAELADEILDGL